MINLFAYALINRLLCLIFIFITVFRYKKCIEKERSRPFECGFDPTGCSRLNFCIKFFLVGVIFLIFDVEVRLILPLPFSQTYLLLLLIVLFLGLAYE